MLNNLIIGEPQDTARVHQNLSRVVSNGGDVSPVLDPLLLTIGVIRSPVEELVFETVFDPEILPVLSSNLSPV
jgi:hypothetical protein